MDRAQVIHNCIDEHDADIVIVSFLPYIRWLTGFTGSNGLVVSSKEGIHFITDGRYKTQSKQEVKKGVVHIASNNLLEYSLEVGVINGDERIVIQAECTSLSQFEEYKKLLPNVEWVPASLIFDKAVAVKNEEERESILQSQRVTDAVFSYLIDFVQPGMTEQELAAEIVYQHMQRGATGMSFDPIVASGPNSALPHARPTSRELQLGDMVVIDMGCFVQGYASDMTRTISIGTPTPEVKKVYQVVLDAQQSALEKASSQLTSRELDAVARSLIEDAGYGAYFSHSLGHGVGLQIHEWPSISWRSDHKLEPGMVVTIEPGIYLPEKFGVRIEDMIQLTEFGCENLTASRKDLIII